jgi:glutamate/tyrosine decarboxylase-like PLP-dependent enzyme
VSTGQEGFMKNSKAIMDATQRIVRGVKAIPGLKLVGGCEAMIVCFTGAVPTEKGKKRKN